MPNIFIVGDSLVYGKWDPEGGWAARLRKYVDGKYNLGTRTNLLVYVLGIPSETAPRLAERLRGELLARIDPAGKNLLIISSGMNDSCPNNKVTGELTPKGAFMDSYGSLIDTGAEFGCKVVALGLTPVNPSRSKGLLFSNELVAEYDGYISQVCREKNVVKLELFETLNAVRFADDLVDSVHPDAIGHECLFTLVRDFLEKEVVIETLISREDV